MPFHLEIRAHDGVWCRFTQMPFDTKAEAELHCADLRNLFPLAYNEANIRIIPIDTYVAHHEDLSRRLMAACPDVEARAKALVWALPQDILQRLVEEFEGQG